MSPSEPDPGAGGAVSKGKRAGGRPKPGPSGRSGPRRTKSKSVPAATCPVNSRAGWLPVALVRLGRLGSIAKKPVTKADAHHLSARHTLNLQILPKQPGHRSGHPHTMHGSTRMVFLVERRWSLVEGEVWSM